MADSEPCILQARGAQAIILGLQRQLDKQYMCDVVLKSEDGASFAAHGVVLAAASEALGAMLNDHFREGRERTLTLATTAGALNVLLSCIYGKDMVVARQDAVDVLKLSHMYGLDFLEQQIVHALANHLDAQIALRLLCECESFLSLGLEEQCQKFLADSFEQSSCTDLFVQLPATQLSTLMSHCCLNVSREELVMEALVKWHRANISSENNIQSVTSLLFQHVRFGLLAEGSLQELAKFAQSLGPCGVELQKQVCKGLRFHLASTTNEHEPPAKRHRKQQWWPGFGSSIAGGIVVASPVSPRSIALQGRDLIVCEVNIPRVLRWPLGASKGMVVAGEGAPINGHNDLGSWLHAAVDGAGGSLLIADYTGNRILRVSDGRSDVVGEGCWELDKPVAVASTPDGAIFVLDKSGNRVQKLLQQSAEIVATTEDNIVCMGGLSVHATGVIHIIHRHKQVLRFEPGATTGRVVAGAGADDRFKGLCVDADETLYVADDLNGQILKWAKGATAPVIVAGGTGNGNEAWRLDGPICVALDAAGALCIGERTAKRVSQWGPPNRLSL